jgi:DUF1680 family protein
MSSELTLKDRITHTYFPLARWRMLPLEAVSLTKGFWFRRQKINREITLPHGYQMLERAGNFDNLRVAAGLIEGEYRGREFLDSDVYKWLEAAAYELQLNPTNETLQRQVDETIDLIIAAQQDDGYLNSYFQVAKSGERWADLDFGHELYCAGHLFQAAVAHYQATQSAKLLDVATRFADYIGSVFGPDKRHGAPGHPEIEMALIALYRVTHKQDYLNLAKFFIDQRGKGVMRGLGWATGPAYHQDRVPVRQASEVEGHAVRAMYLAAGVTDLYLETGEQALLEALLRQWQDMVGRKLFITGGLGSRYEGESFGDPYELPPDQCYCETCAAIGSIMWNWRMLLVTGQGRYADLMERTLYNGFLSGLADDGRHFFYINPLMSRRGAQRKKWYGVACCPPNIMRLLASMGQYVATSDADGGLQIHLYTGAVIQTALPSGQPLSVIMETNYPWHGQISLTIKETDNSVWPLRLRIPGWCDEAQVALNGLPINSPTIVEGGYVVLEHPWQPGDVVELNLALTPRLVEAHPRIDAVRDKVAIQYGPLVYCLEEVDVNANLMDILLNDNHPLEAVWNDNLLTEEMIVVKAAGRVINVEEWQNNLYRFLNKNNLYPTSEQTVYFKAIPYYAWANRKPGAMRVWIPRINKAQR